MNDNEKQYSTIGQIAVTVVCLPFILIAAGIYKFCSFLASL